MYVVIDKQNDYKVIGPFKSKAEAYAYALATLTHFIVLPVRSPNK